MNIIDAFSSWVNLYFFDPLRYPKSFAPYNIYNTATFAIIGLVCAYLIYRYFTSNGIIFNEKLYWAVIPFVLLGSIVRVLVDAKIIPRMVIVFGWTFFPFVTPLIYILIFLVMLLFLLTLRNFFANKYCTIMMYSGLVLDAVFLIPLLLIIKNPISTLYILIMAIVATAIGTFVLRLLRLRATSRIEIFTIFAQCLDGSATFVGVSLFGYFEQHVLGNAIFNFFGTPFAFYALKALFVVLAIKIANDELKDSKYTQLKIFILLMIATFGIGPGIRDMLRLLCGV